MNKIPQSNREQKQVTAKPVSGSTPAESVKLDKAKERHEQLQKKLRELRALDPYTYPTF